MKIIILSLALLSSTSAYAQEALESIRVQGNKEERTYLETTESISVLNEPQLASPTQSNSIQVLNALPNVVTAKNDDSFSIRGINNTGVTGFQKDNLSSIVIDNVFQTDLAIKAGSFDLWDIGGIEVYRGPQSTSQGVNSLAGSILLYHNPVARQNEAAAKIGAGNFGRGEVGLLGNYVLNKDWGTRLSYNKDFSDGYIKNVTTDNTKWGYRNRDNVNWSFSYQPTEDKVWNINTKILQTKNGGTYVQSGDPFVREVREDVDFQSRTENQQISLQYSQKLSESWGLDLTTAYSQSRQQQTSDADGTATNVAGTREEDHKDRFASLEALLKYRSEKIRNVLGLHLHDFYLKDDYNFTLMYPVTTTVSTPVATTQTTDKYRTVSALFNSWLYELDEQQSVSLGLRYEYVQNKYGADVQARRLQNLGGANATIDSYLNKVSGSYDSKNNNSIVLPKLAYTFTAGANNLGASYSQGYRTGGLSINRSRAETNEYSPEYTHNYELSYKREGEIATLSSNIFYTNWQEQQVQIQFKNNDPYDTQVTNAAHSELYGAEFESKFRLSTQQSLNASVGYVKTRFLNFSANGVDYTGKEFPQAPNWTGQLSYLISFTEHLNLNNTWRYLSKSFSNAENNRISPEQYYWDANLQYAGAQWVADLYVKNILHAEYLIYDGRPKNAGTAYNANYNQINAPQEFGARFTYYF